MSEKQEMDDHEEDEQRNQELVTLKDVYLHSVFVHERSMPQFKFHEDVSVQSRSDRYMLLLSGDERAIFHVSGIITHLNVTAAGAVQHRKPGSRIDEYTVRLRIDDDKLAKPTEKGFQMLTEVLKRTTRACENIAVGSGLVKNRKAFKLDEITIKMSNYKNDVFYFYRKVATRDAITIDDGETPDFWLQFPRQGQDYPLLRYPAGWNLNPPIPVTNKDALQIQTEAIDLPRRDTIYFEIRQGCYNFEEKEGQMKQIVLIPSVIAIKLYPPAPEELGVAQRAKKPRLSCH